MKNKVIFFSIDRLGDYLIKSNVIFNISKLYKKSDIVVSDKNFKLVNTQNIFNKVILFNTRKKIFNKLKFILIFLFKKYDAAISFDGKNISNILLIVVRAKFKHVFIYKKKGVIKNIRFNLYCKFLNFLDISFTIMNSRELIELDKKEHYPTKYKLLKKYFNNIDNKTYYLEELVPFKNINLNEDFILIHLDEKFDDIIDIKTNFSNSLNNLSNNLDKKIILTTFKNNFEYYKNLLIEKISYQDIKKHNLYNKKICILEDVPLNDFYYLIKNSSINISCHGGFFVHASLLNNKNTIDIINNSDEKWLNTWITKSDTYKIVYKSNSKKKIYINEILLKLNNTINEF